MMVCCCLSNTQGQSGIIKLSVMVHNTSSQAFGVERWGQGKSFLL